MDFKQAMEAMRKGAKIRRPSWEPSLHLRKVVVKIKDTEETQEIIQAYRLQYNTFEWNLSTLDSNDWLIEGSLEEVPFEEVAVQLQKGKKARLKNWEDNFIILDKASNEIVFVHYAPYPFCPNFRCICSNDWVIYENKIS